MPPTKVKAKVATPLSPLAAPKPKPKPATPKSVSTPKAAASAASPKAKTKPAAAKAKPKTTTAPKIKQKTQGSAPAPSPHRAPTRPNVSTKLSPELLGPVDKVKQALSAQSAQRPLNTIIEKLPTLPPINKLAVVDSEICKALAKILRSELLGEFGHSCSLLVHIVAEDNPDAIYPILKEGLSRVLIERLDASKQDADEDTVIAIYDLSQGTTDEKIQLVEQRALPVLVRLLEHPNLTITNASIIALHNIILAGAQMSPDNEPHPFLDKMEDSGSLSRIFKLWTRKADEDSERTVASTLSILHRMKLLDDEFKPIIATVVAEVANGEDNEKSDALQALTYLTGVPENHKALLDANILQTIDQLFSSKPSNNVICNVFAFLTSLARAGVPTTKQAILQILPMAALDTWRKKEDEGKAAGDEDLIAVGNNAHALLLEMQK